MTSPNNGIEKAAVPSPSAAVPASAGGSTPARADGYAVVLPDGHFVGIWRTEEAAKLIVNRSPSAKGERIVPMRFVASERVPPIAYPTPELERLRRALQRIAITDDEDCRHANDPKAMTRIAREALR